jgi:hypothetical protein
MNNKSPITVSELQSGVDPDGGKWHSRYIYAECSYCEMLDDLMRVSFYYEKNKDDGEVFSSVDFQFPDKFYIQPGWHRVPRTVWGRIDREVGCFFRRLWLAFKLVTGGKVFLAPVTDFNLVTIKELARKIIEVVEEAEKGTST